MIRWTTTGKSVKVTFALPLAQVSGKCSVVGDSHDWAPGQHEMRRRGNGTRIRFRYLAEDGRWFNDREVSDRDGSDTVLVV